MKTGAKLNTLLATLAFYAKYPGVHAFKSNDLPTRLAVEQLSNMGYLRVHWESSTAEFTGKVFETPA